LLLKLLLIVISELSSIPAMTQLEEVELLVKLQVILKTSLLEQQEELKL
jgi:hypothetical protein